MSPICSFEETTPLNDVRIVIFNHTCSNVYQLRSSKDHSRLRAIVLFYSPDLRVPGLAETDAWI